jgi:hypothetical protein
VFAEYELARQLGDLLQSYQQNAFKSHTTAGTDGTLQDKWLQVSNQVNEYTNTPTHIHTNTRKHVQTHSLIMFVLIYLRQD